MIVTPGQLTQRAEFYYQLNQLTAAGLGLLPALEQLKRNPPARSYRKPIRHILDELAKGFTFTESLKRAGQWLPEFDVTLIEAGEKTGRIDAAFRLLADHYTDRSRLMRQMIADLAYPVFLFHFFIFIMSFPQLFLTGNWIAYARQTIGVLIPIYGAVLLLIYAAQSKRGETWRGLVESILRPIPVLGTARRCLALARLSAALEALISAGVTIIEAWELAARASGSPALVRTVSKWKPQLTAGQTPTEVVSASREFPELFANQYAAGEVSGKLDDSLRRLHNYYQDEGSRKIKAVARWVPIFIYLVIVFLIASYILRFYMGHFRDIQNAITF